MKSNRRTFIKTTMAAGVGAIILPNSLAAIGANEPYAQLPALDYAYDELEPFIDALTMTIHHSKHHQAYVDKLNEAVAKENFTSKPTLESLLSNVSTRAVAFRNHGGGHYNHSLYWKILQPVRTEAEVPARLKTAIDSAFGSVSAMQQQMNDAALKRFGSGWTWLVQQNNALVITSTPNQDNPLMDVAEVQGHPLIGIDVWEHAYYLKHQNKRGEHLNDFWKIINWDAVAARMK